MGAPHIAPLSDFLSLSASLSAAVADTYSLVGLQGRQDQEGSLFLTKRRSHPRFQLTILNKKSGSAHSTLNLGLWQYGGLEIVEDTSLTPV